MTIAIDLFPVAAALSIRTDGVTERELALAILQSIGWKPESATTRADGVTQTTGYLVARAHFEYANKVAAADQRRDAESFATAPRAVMRTDTPSSSDPFAAERAERAAMERRSRTAHKIPIDEATAKADEAEALETIRARFPRPIDRPVPQRSYAVGMSEAAAKAQRNLDSRNAHKIKGGE